MNAREPGVGRSPADEAVFRPVRDGNAFEETVERLLQAIKLGVVPPGERLPPERVLAARFKVSRVTLREAIGDLTKAGYVESRRGRYGGTFVLTPHPPTNRVGRPGVTAQELEDVLVLRQVLEVGASVAAADSAMTRRDRAHLTAMLEECASASLEEYRRMDSRLHLAIAEVTGSASLTAAVADARSRLNGLLDEMPFLERNLAHSNLQHARIVAAVLEGDTTSAGETMSEHLSGTAALLRGFLT